MSKDELLQSISKTIDQFLSVASPVPVTMAPYDPFDESKLVHRKDKAEPGMNQARFYYYYHRPSGKMIIRYRANSYLVESIETRGVDTWIIKHTEGPLKYLVTGNATRIYISGSNAILS